MIGSLQVIPFSANALYDALSNALLPATQVEKEDRPKYLARYLEAMHASTIVVESEYTDGNYLDDYAEYYVKCWWNYERRCKRLHFFAPDFSRDDFLEIVRGERSVESITENNGYLGFVVARPLPQAIIGRTVLRPYPDDGGRRHYPVSRPYSANLFGISLELESLGYQEQDTVIAACATVALWAAFQKTSDLFGTPEPTPKQITATAGQIVRDFRTFPSRGLTFEQMTHAIRSVGLESEKVELTGQVPLLSLIYAHVSHGVPVILLLEVDPPARAAGFHAVLIAGFSLREGPALEREVAGSTQTLRSTALRIDELYVHDDQVGPFSRVRVLEPEVRERVGETVEFPVVLQGEITPGGQTYKLWPVGATVPVYHKVRVTFLDVHGLAYVLDQFLQKLYPDQVEWDITLTTTNELKQAIKKEQELPRAVRERILLLQHPRYLWRAQVTIGDVRALEFLVDATDMARSFPIYDMVWYDQEVRSIIARMVTKKNLRTQVEETLSYRFVEFLATHC